MGKRLGQHFLKNPETAKRIVEALGLRAGDTVIEVGAGRGALTKDLGPRIKDLGGRLIAIEKDKRLAQQVAQNFQFPIINFQSIFNYQFSNTQHAIVQGDVLQVLPFLDIHWKLDIRNWKLAGNIPYYITGRLFRVIGELEHKPEVVVLMIQKEVAERVTALPPKMNLLAASVQAWAEVKVLFSVSKKEFKPMPKVDSAVIRLRTQMNAESASWRNADERRNYYSLIKVLFKQPRKTILNNLFAGFNAPKEELARTLQRAHVNPSDRPQVLSVELITKLARMLYNR